MVEGVKRGRGIGKRESERWGKGEKERGRNGERERAREKGERESEQF